MIELIGIMVALIAGILLLAYAVSYFLLSGGKSQEQIVDKYKGTKEAKSVFVKKYEEADTSQVRTALLAFGAVLAFSSSIYALTWRDKPIVVEKLVMETIEEEFEVEPPPTEQVKPPPPPPPPPDIQVVEDDEILEDEPEIEEIEIEEDEVIEIPEVIEEEEVVVEQEIFTIVEEMPRFKGCEKVAKEEVKACTDSEILKYITKNVVYPQMAIENDIQGKVYVRFIVDSDGKVTDVSIAKSADKLLEQAALKVVKSFPQFTPGKQRGKSVRVQYVIPVNFKLS